MSALQPKPELTHKSDSVFVDKKNGTKVNYYIFPEFEIHANEIAPHTEQQWHHHKEIEEVLYVTQGELAVGWLDENNKKQEAILRVGDVFRVQASIHTAANKSDQATLFTVFRYVPDGQDKHELIKNDRYPDEVKEMLL